MKFSVIVPVYNVQDYLEECCNSVLCQTYQEYELILVDDGSSDCSGMLCDQIADTFPEKCITVHTENQGPLHARQTGIHAATGDVLVFLDADDCIRRDALEKLCDCFRKTNCDMVLYNASDKEDYSVKFCGFPFQHLFTMDEDEKSVLYRAMVLSHVPNAVWLKAVKKQCAASHSDFADMPYVKNGEDLLMSMYMVTAAGKIVYLDENLYFYRQREGSIVHSFHPDRARSIKTVHLEMERFIDVWGMPELHPAHYAREVHGWIETLLILLENKEHMEPQQFQQQLQNMATDAYFLRAYTSMDTTALSRIYRLLAKWLYGRQYKLLYIAASCKKMKSKLKAISKV